MAIYHILLVRYKAEVTEVQKQEWKNEICALATKIPSVKEVNTGKKIPTERGKEWDDGIVMLFDNAEGLQEYYPHPAHIEFKAYAAPFIADLIDFDIDSN